METNKQTKEAQCLTCGYTWKTASTKIYVNCPSCRSAVKINNILYNGKTSKQLLKESKQLGDVQ